MGNQEEKKYRGVVVPMVTPFQENGKIDENSVIKIIQRFIAAGVGVFVLGTTGEAHSIPMEERLNLVKLIGQKFGARLPVYAGIASNCFQTSVELAKRFYDFGIETFVAHLPFYYPISDYQMRIYYETLVEAIPGNLMLYNIPVTTGISIPLEVAEALSHHPRIVGIKDSERNAERLLRSLQLWKERSDFSHFLGWASQSKNALMKGTDGIVPATGNLAPEKFQKLYEAAIRGEMSVAEEYQQETDAISEIYQKNRILSELIAALKVMMEFFDLCTAKVLPPLVELSENEKAKIIQQIKILNLNLEN